MGWKKAVLFLFVAAVVLPVSPLWACSPGDKAEVLWKGSWYPAHVKKVNGDQCFIHYVGYGKNWDEWVGPARIRILAAAVPVGDFHEGDPVQVLWKGSWWPAHVLKVNGGQLKIHYDGYDNSWDEWIGPARYRKS